MIRKHRCQNPAGLGSKWINPFSTEKTGIITIIVKSLEEANQRYKEYILSRADLIQELKTIRYSQLECTCKTDTCHLTILSKIKHEGKETGLFKDKS